MTPRGWSLILASVAAIAGCGDELRYKFGERLQQRLVDGPAPVTDAAPPPPTFLNSKLRLYIDCANTSRVPLYAGFRQANAALTAGSRRAGVVEPVFDEVLERCVRAQREGPLHEPALPALEAAAEEYLAQSREFLAAINAVPTTLTATDIPSATTPQQEFEAVFTRWDAARHAFDRELDAYQAAADAAILAEIEDRAGHGLEWHVHEMMRTARPYARCLGDHDEITAKICGGLYDAFESAFTAFHRLFDSDPATAARVFWLPQFVASLDEYRNAVEHLHQDLAANRAHAGDIGHVLREYNDLLRNFDSLNFDGAQLQRVTPAVGLETSTGRDE